MSLNSMRVGFGHYAKWVMGIMFVAMVATTFSWNGLGRNAGGSASATTQSPDDVVAKVDGQDVTRNEVDDSIDRMSQFGGNGIMMAPFIRQYALQQVEQSNEELAKAQTMGITATDSDIADMRDQALRAQHVRQTLGLADSANLSEVDAALQQNGKSLDLVLPEAEIKQAVILKKLQDRVQKGAVASEQDTRNSYTQYHTRHILIDAQKRSDVQAQLLAKQVIAKASAPGADFAALAKKYSEDFGTKNKGGDDGWIDDKTQYVPEFKKAAFALQPGQVTPDPVKSTSYTGYFIIKLDAVRSNLPADFDKNKAKYISDYAKTKQDQAWHDFETELEQAPHNIVMLDPGLKGDQEMQDAQKNMADQVKQQASYHAAIADYQKAIKAATSGRDKADFYLQIANADDALKDIAGETAAYAAASKANGAPDPQLEMKLGDLYKQQGQNDNAVLAYQAASKSAWNNVQTHTTLATDYDALGHKDLADNERSWVADYNKHHPASKTPGGMMAGPGGQPITLTPSGGGGNAQPITVSTAPAKGGAQPVAVTTTTANAGGHAVSVTPVTGKPAAGGQEFAVTNTNGKVKVTPVKPAQ